VQGGLERNSALLHVTAKVENLGYECSAKTMFMTQVNFTGSFLQLPDSRLVFTLRHAQPNSTDISQLFRVQVGRERPAEIEHIAQTYPSAIVTDVHRRNVTASFGRQHTVKIVAKLAGNGIHKFAFLNMFISRAAINLNDNVGGLLGNDDHTLASTPPTYCKKGPIVLIQEKAQFAGGQPMAVIG